MATSTDWRSCVDWLVKCQLIPPDHAVTKPTAEVYDLAQLLRDGVLLCHLLNRLQPGLIDPKHFSQRPQLCQFLCLKNIRVFLENCLNVFGLKETDLFDAKELFDVKDFGKVITTLSKLSRSPEAQKSGINGFLCTSSPTTNKEYMNLEEFAAEREDDIYDHTAYDLDTREDEIYEDLCSVRKQNRAIQSSVSIAKTKREYCITELVETERYYVEVLNMIIQNFMRPLSTLLPPDDHRIIFAYIEDLHQIHTGFHSELSQACNLGNIRMSEQPAIPDCFIKWKEKFLIYGDYCSNLPKSYARLDHAKSSASMDAKLQECERKSNDGKFRLRDLFTVPFQRVLKYHLLLKELIKNTDPEHRERHALQKALEEMQDLSLYVNEVKRDNETLQVINDIETNIVDLDMPENTSLRDYGRLLRDGELKIKKHPNNSTKSRFVFLFDKVLLMCKSRGNNYNYKDALVLNSYRLESCPKPDKNGFGVNLVEKEEQVVYTIYTKTDDDKTKWIEAIRLAHENTSPPLAKTQTHDFVMFSFTTPTICDVCRKLLRGVFFQGYKCSKTGMCVHKECIPKARDFTGPPRPPPRFKPVIAKVKAKLAFQGQTGPSNGRRILTFSEGDVIDLLDNTDQMWWEGRFNGLEGFFPPSHVNLIRFSQRQSYESAEPVLPPQRLSQLGLPEPVFERSNSCSTNNVDMSSFAWYVAEVSRDQATVMLENCSSGTFLIRKSVNPSNRGNYALSIKFGLGRGSVKHIKIEQIDNKFYLADCQTFRSIPELVNYYKENSLKTSFPELETTLLIAYKDAINQPNSTQVIGFCRAMYDYSANQPNQLSLRSGERIAITSKAGDSRGWWKGNASGRSGYFPCAYVEEED